MSRESEKTLRGINEFLAQNVDENMSMDEMNELVQKYMEEYNANLSFDELTEETAETSDDYYELALDTKTKAQALKYARKAVKLDPDNLDAKEMLAQMTTEHPFELVDKSKHLIDYGKKMLERNGYFNEESFGDYWTIIETRPFIRVYSHYLDLLIDCNMMRKAASIGEEIIRFNEGDNLGIRYRLMHIYAYLEDEKSMLELHHKYDNHEQTQFLLPMSILYFKLDNYKKAKEYLERLTKVNKDTSKFVKAIMNDSLDKYMSCMSDMGYQPYTIEEFIVEMQENVFLFETVPCYIDWAVQTLKKK